MKCRKNFDKVQEETRYNLLYRPNAESKQLGLLFGLLLPAPPHLLVPPHKFFLFQKYLFQYSGLYNLEVIF